MKIIMTSSLAALLVLGNLGPAVQGRLGGTRTRPSDEIKEDATMIFDSTATSTSSTSRALQASSGSGSRSPCSVDGFFQPDPTRYYTVADPSGDVVWANPTSRFDSPGVRVQTLSKARFSGEDYSHWRFVESGDGTFHIVNRDTGFKMFRATNGVAATRHQPGTRDPISFAPTCDSSGNVFFAAPLEPAEGALGAFPRCGVDGCINGASVNMVPKQRIVTKRSGCVPITRPCSTIFGPGFTEISRDFIGFCGNKKTCRGPVDEPNQLLSQVWSVQEVGANFVKQKAIRPSAVPQSEEESALKAMGVEVALGTAEGLVGDAAAAVIDTICPACTIALPLVSSVIGLGVGFLGPEEESIDAKLNEMAEATGRLIDSSIVSNDIEAGRLAINSQRRYFMTTYREQKANAIEISSLKDQDELAGDLREAARLHLVAGMQRFFILDENIEDPREKDVIRAQEGFEYLKVAIMENLSMHLEAFLLDELANLERPNQLSCFRIAKAASLDDKATQFKREIQKNYQILFDRRVNDDVIQSKCGVMNPFCPDNILHQKRCKELQDFLVTDSLSTSGGTVRYHANPRTINQDEFDAAFRVQCPRVQTYEALRRDEVTFDMENLSYRLGELVEYLDGYFDNAVTMCNELRTDEEFRTLFATRDGAEVAA